MLLRRIFFIACVFAVVSSHAALTVTERVVTLPDPVKVPLAMDNTTVQYLYNVGTQSYFLGANEYNTRASVSQSKGYKVKVEDFGGMYAIRDSVEEGSPRGQWLKMFANDATGIWVDNDNGVNVDAWVIDVAADGTFQIYNPAAAEGVLGVDKGDGDTRLYLYPQDRENFSYTWYAVSVEDYEANIEARPNVIATNEALKKLWEILVDADKAGVPGLSQYEAIYADETATPETLNEAAANVQQAKIEYMVSKATAAEPVDLSLLIENRTFDIIGDFTGWSGTAFGADGTTSTCAEHYDKNTFDTYQQIDNVPNGVWALNVDGFYRYSGSWDDHVNGTDGPVKLYATNIKANEEQSETYTGSIMSIYDGIEAGNNTVSDNTRTDTYNGENYIVPWSMKGATNYFDAGFYKDNEVLFAVTEGSMRIGVAKQEGENNDWAVFDNFGLKYYGNSANVYQMMNDVVLAQAPVYDAGEVLVSKVVLEKYNAARGTVAISATYEELMKNKQTLAAARAEVDANIAAWKNYQTELELTANITDDPNYGVDNVKILSNYVKSEAPKKIEERGLTTEEIIAEINKVKKLYENALHDINIEIRNPNFSAGWDGWEHKGNSININTSARCAEACKSPDFDIYQEIGDLNKGVYKLSMQGFYRRGRGDNAWQYYFNTSTGEKNNYVEPARAFVYINDIKVPLMNVFEYKVPLAENYYQGDIMDYYTSPEINGEQFTYPNGMPDAGLAFDHDAYKMSVFSVVVNDGGTLRIGVKGDAIQEGDSWAIFSNFKLTYYGTSAEAYHICYADYISRLPRYKTNEIQVTSACVDTYNALLAKTVGTYEELTETMAAVDAAQADLEANIAAWKSYEEQLKKVIGLSTKFNKPGDEIDILYNYVELQAKKIKEAKSLTTQELIVEVAKLKELCDNVQKKFLTEGTNLTVNPDFSEGEKGWNFKGDGLKVDSEAKCAEAYWSENFDIWQEIKDVPVGRYMLSVQGFYRRGRDDDAWKLYFDEYTGKPKETLPEIPANIYMNDIEIPLKYVFEYKVPLAENYYTGNYYTSPAINGEQFTYPNNMGDAGLAFGHGAYEQSSFFTVTKRGETLRIGMKGDTTQDEEGSWAIFTGLKLTYIPVISQIRYLVEDTVYNIVDGISDQKLPTIPTPEKPGYTFAGWDGMPTDSIMPAHDLTLTAKWNRVYRRTWDFRNGYSATTLEAMAHDTENWTVQPTGFQNTQQTTTTAMMHLGGEIVPVPELEGLALGGLKNEANVLIYDGKSKNSSFPANAACLWLNGGNSDDYVEFLVPAGENVKFGYCSHSSSQSRGFKTSSEGFADADGKTLWTSMADCTIKEVELINSNTEESTLRLNTTNGSHIYYIIIGDGDAPGAGMISLMQIYDNEPTQLNAAGFSTMAYSDGASVSLTGRSDKEYSNGLDITINDAQYTTTKASNGSQNTFYAPKGKRIYSFTLYSYINLGTKNRNTYWNEVGNVVYEFNKNTEMLSYKDGSNPDKYTYVFSGGVDSVTFTNTGEQVAFVIGVNYLTENFPTVTYIVDGTVYHSGSGIPGQKIQVATSPEKIGYTFAGWDGMPTDSIMPANDVTLTALWTVNKYGLNYILDGERLRVDSIAYGETIVPAMPDARHGCQFGGWEGIPSVMPADDVTVYGYNHIIDTEEVALDGHLTDVLLSDINALKQVKSLDLGAVTNNSLPIGGLATLQTAVLPAGLRGYDGVLTDCPNLLEVTLNNNVTIPSGAFTGSGTNTNMIVYAPARTEVDYDGNVVVGGVAENITLEDGKALSISREFTAQKISYSREFTKTSYLNECAGWETIVLPFDVETVKSGGSSLVPFNKHGMTGDKYYWLAGLTPSGFGVASRIQANVPYIICMPNSEVYESSFNITGTVTFSATDAVVRRTSDARAFSGPDVELVPSYLPVERSMEVYSINDEDYDGHHPGSLFVINNRDVRPFEAYVRRTTTTSLATMSFAIGEMNATGIMNIGTSGFSTQPAYFDALGRQSTSSYKGLRIIRDKNGRYIKRIGDK